MKLLSVQQNQCKFDCRWNQIIPIWSIVALFVISSGYDSKDDGPLLQFLDVIDLRRFTRRRSFHWLHCWYLLRNTDCVLFPMAIHLKGTVKDVAIGIFRYCFIKMAWILYDLICITRNWFEGYPECTKSNFSLFTDNFQTTFNLWRRKILAWNGNLGGNFWQR